jgi:S1-C subfamily serine protease
VNAKNSSFAFLIIFVSSLIGCASVPKEPYPGQNTVRAQYESIKYLRENITDPSSLRIDASVSLTTPTKSKVCTEDVGTASVISKNGYFLTTAHNVSASHLKDACLQGMAKDKNNPFLNGMSASDFDFTISYTLTDSQGRTFQAVPVKIWPEKEKDMAVFRTDRDYHITWKPIVFSDAASFSDEPVAASGTPVGINNMLVTGKVARSELFTAKGQKFLLVNLPLSHGNSGGSVINLLDMTAIGITSIVLEKTGFAGILPAWVIKEALKEIKME